MTTNTTIAHKAARRKPSLLELASDMDNVSKALDLPRFDGHGDKPLIDQQRSNHGTRTKELSCRVQEECG